MRALTLRLRRALVELVLQWFETVWLEGPSRRAPGNDQSSAERMTESRADTSMRHRSRRRRGLIPVELLARPASSADDDGTSRLQLQMWLLSLSVRCWLPFFPARVSSALFLVSAALFLVRLFSILPALFFQSPRAEDRRKALKDAGCLN